MRSLSDLPDLVRVGPTSLGEEWWARGGELGSSVLTFREPAHLAAYASLHEEAHLWVHRDYDHGASWLVDVRTPEEVGADFVMMKRGGGVAIRHFYPDRTDDPVPPPPEGRLEKLGEVLDTLCAEAATDIDRFLAELVRGRVRALAPGVNYDQVEQRFDIDNLDPTPEELAAWDALTRSPRALVAMPLRWRHSGDGEIPYRCEYAGRRLAVRVNDFPAEPLYTLLADGAELTDLDDWPAAWTKEAPPQHLLDLAAKAQKKP